MNRIGMESLKQHFLINGYESGRREVLGILIVVQRKNPRTVFGET
jgi:hypothetical protein